MEKLTKYEQVRIIGTRATQISMGAPSTIDITGMTDAIVIAEAELKAKKIPLIIKRKYPNGEVREIRVCDMECN